MMRYTANADQSAQRHRVDGSVARSTSAVAGDQSRLESAPTRSKRLSGFPPAGAGDFTRLASSSGLAFDVVHDVYKRTASLDPNSWCRLARAAVRLGLSLPPRNAHLGVYA